MGLAWVERWLFRDGETYGEGIRVEVDGEQTILVVVVEGGNCRLEVVRHDGSCGCVCVGR